MPSKALKLSNDEGILGMTTFTLATVGQGVLHVNVQMAYQTDIEGWPLHITTTQFQKQRMNNLRGPRFNTPPESLKANFTSNARKWFDQDIIIFSSPIT